MFPGLTAGQVCRRDVVAVHRTVVLLDAARTMRERHVGSLVVVDEAAPGERFVVGMLTDRDLVVSVVARDLDARALRVEDVMSTDLATVRETDPVPQILALMWRRGVRRVPVTDGEGRLVGIVAADDLVELIAGEMASLAQALAAGPRREERARP